MSAIRIGTATAPALALEVVTLPVSDVDRALRFYADQVGFALDVDYAPTRTFRVVQLTPPASSLADFADPDGNRWVLQERGFHRR